MSDIAVVESPSPHVASPWRTQALFALALLAIVATVLLGYSMIRRLEAVPASAPGRDRQVMLAIAFQAGTGLLSVAMLVIAYVRTQREQRARVHEAEAQAHHRSTLDLVSDGVIATDTDGRVTLINEAAVRATGWTPSDAVGEPIAHVLSLRGADGHVPAENPALRAIRDGHDVGLNARTVLLSRTDDHVPVEHRARPLRASDDRIAGAVVAFRDVGERRHLEIDLERSRGFLRSILDALPTHVAMLDRDGHIVAVNAAWRRFADENGFRGTGHAGVADHLAAGCDEDRAGQIADGIRSVLEGHRPDFSAEYTCRVPGKLRWFQIQVTSLDGLEQVKAVVAHEEISERVESQIRTERQSDQLQRLADVANLVNAAQDVRSVLGLVTAGARGILDAERVVAYAVAGADGLVNEAQAPQPDPGQSPSRGGRSSWRSAPSEPLERVMRLTRAQLEAIPAWRTFFAGAGHGVPGAWMGVPLVGRDGQHLGAIHMTSRDESTFTEHDEPIVAQLARLAASALEGASLYEELREGDRRKDEFLATLAHELRNPLAPMRNVIEIIKRAPEAATLKDAASVLERQLRQMVRLIDDLLDISRITKGKLELRQDRLDVGAVIRDAVESCRPSIDASGHHLHLSLPLEPVVAFADHARLSQVFANLIDNAAKYSERGGTIEISLDTTAREATVRVRDEGIGIDPEMLPRLFDMFTQGDHSRERARGGLGIGLTLVRSIVELHGGRVQASSAGPGMGSTFVVRLPLASTRRRTAEHPIAGGPAVQPSFRPHRVLVVDDNPDAAESLSMLLRLEGHDVRVAEDGRSALELASAFEPSVALLDIGLPGMSGYDVARALRNDPKTARCKLIALTGWGQDADRRRSAEAGLDHHLVKPLELDALKRLLDS